MAYGMRVWDAAGVLQLDTSTQMGRLLGRITTPEGSGSVGTGTIYDDGLLTGTLFVSTNNRKPLIWSNATISVSVSGNALSWSISKGTYPTYSNNFYQNQRTLFVWPTFTIMYGVK